MDNDRLVDLLLELASLKRLPRSGWLLRGVPHVESVAEHSFRWVVTAGFLRTAIRRKSSKDYWQPDAA